MRTIKKILTRGPLNTKTGIVHFFYTYRTGCADLLINENTAVLLREMNSFARSNECKQLSDSIAALSLKFLRVYVIFHAPWLENQR